MKGTVDVYRVSEKRELLCRDTNLIVDGAGESIVDILTLPPTLNVSSLGTADTEVDTIFDTSNYCISLMSLGKSKVGYEKNLHTYKRHNLIENSDDLEGIIFENTILTPVFTESPADSSSVVHRISSTNNDGGYIEWDTFDVGYINFINSAPKVFSMDIKLDHNDSVSPTTDAAGVSRSYVTIRIGSEESHSFFTFGFTSPEVQQLGQVKGILDYVVDADNRSVFYKHLGNNWYRVGCVIPGEINFDGTDTNFSIRVYPCSVVDETGEEASDRIGSILISRPSYNLGSLPITYYLGNEPHKTLANDFDEYPALYLSVAQTRNDPYLLQAPGTLTNYTNGYNVSGELCKHPDPNDETLQPDTTTSYAHSVDCKMTNGHNLNMHSLARTDRASLSDFIGEGWQYSTAYANLTIPSDFAWFGCFATNNERADYRVRIGDIHDQASWIAAANTGQVITGQKFSSRETMGYDGFIRVFNNKTTAYVDSNNNNALSKVVSNENVANDGVVTFKLVITAPDRYMANCFGGVFEAGLYTLDVPKTVKLNNKSIDKSISRTPVYGDKLESRLFCKKSFTFDITNNPNFSDESTVEIFWTLDFNES
jgi:hypothetical protein